MNYDTSLACWAITAPTQLLSYHELLFIKAEVLCRLNKTSEAESVLREAIIAGFINTEITLKSAIYDWGSLVLLIFQKRWRMIISIIA